MLTTFNNVELESFYIKRVDNPSGSESVNNELSNVFISPRAGRLFFLREPHHRLGVLAMLLELVRN